MSVRSLALIVATCIAVCIFAVCILVAPDTDNNKNKNDLTANNQTSSQSTGSTSSENQSSTETDSSSEQTSSDTLSGNESSSDISSSEESVSSATSSTVSSGDTTTDDPIKNELFPGYKYNSVFDIEDNVFLDALTYTGYNMKKHRNDGLMWHYILSSDKKWRGWLSNITYGGGSSGLETTKDGLPNIKSFERGGLVCASFATYVYFNYLPNIAKIDTSSLDIPERTYNAHSFYLAAKKWLAKGYTYNIGFTAKNTASGIVFNPEEEIPIGSIIVFRDLDSPGKTEADHITIYVGKKNGYHWVIQTGNKNGPEFCAVERFKFGPDPQWPLKIFATPTCIYDAAGEQAAAQN